MDKENRVECRSEYQYEQAPIAVYWEGQRLEVDAILAEWRTPQGKGFRILAGNAGVFEVFYHQGSAHWDIRHL